MEHDFFSIQLGIIIPTDELIYFHRIFPGFSFPAVIRPWRDADVQALHRPATPSFPRRRQRHLGVALRAALRGRRPRGAAVGAAKGTAGAGLADAGGVGGVDGQGSLGRSDLWPASGIVWIIYIYTHIYICVNICIYIYICIYYKWANALVRRPPFKGGGRKAHVYIYIIIH